MILKKLYTEPGDLFEDVTFKMGGNLIFGHKDPDVDTKKSMNGIGKSTFLDLLDFCLLSSYSKTKSNRLYLAEGILTKHHVVLDFEVDGITYSIKRSVDEPNEITVVNGGGSTELGLKEGKKWLSHLVFERNDYNGIFSEYWYRDLMLLFLKIHKTKKQDKYIDPISYIDKVSLHELIQYHLFMLGLDNRLSYKNNHIQNDKKRKVPALREVKEIVEETYGVRDIEDANSQLLTLQSEIRKLEGALEGFRLSENYKASEGDIDNLTITIKELLLANLADHKRISDYEQSLSTNVSFTKRDASTVAKIYKELNEDFSQRIKLTLDAAIDFRKELTKSRSEFIGAELQRLRQVVIDRQIEIDELDKRRGEILGFLKAKEAITDLTSAFKVLSQKKQDLLDLSAKLNTYNTLEKETTDIEAYEKSNDSEILSFVRTLQTNEVLRLHELFMEIYTNIYSATSVTPARFSITNKINTDAKISIDVSIPADNSKANNQGRTLVYDLLLMLNMIQQGIKGPRFIVHDGIFDGMDRAHFVALHKFLSQDLRAKKFQYIYTLNEEGELNESFGATDEVNVDHLKNEAILVLTAKHKLLGEFDK